jgi:hypothetical protein
MHFDRSASCMWLAISQATSVCLQLLFLFLQQMFVRAHFANQVNRVCSRVIVACGILYIMAETPVGFACSAASVGAQGSSTCL